MISRRMRFLLRFQTRHQDLKTGVSAGMTSWAMTETLLAPRASFSRNLFTICPVTKRNGMEPRLRSCRLGKPWMSLECNAPIGNSHPHRLAVNSIYAGCVSPGDARYASAFFRKGTRNRIVSREPVTARSGDRCCNRRTRHTRMQSVRAPRQSPARMFQVRAL